MSFSWLKMGAAAVALTVAGTTAGFASGLPGLGTPVDMGSLRTLAGDQTMTVTLPLSLSNLAGAEEMMRRVATPGDTLFHQFLTPAQIRTSFGPDEKEVARVTSVLQLSGLSVERPSTTTLKVTGLTSTIERVFQTELHQFQTAATETSPAVTFHAPTAKPTVPSSIAGTVQGVLGLDTAPHFRSYAKQVPKEFRGSASSKAVNDASDGTPFGVLTVTDFAKLYDVEPVYAKGISGAGRTLAVVTLAAFTPSDAVAYWASLDLDAKPNRITIVNVDGGPGAPSDASGSIETTLDVEQSGGIAPQADIIVYQAPNTNQGFVDVFAKAVDDNIADSMSTSFGGWEFFFTEQAGETVTSDLDGEMVSGLQAMHELFVVGALQGESLFAAAGDCGAFDVGVNPGFTTPLSVDYPGDDPAIVSSGGTTLPGVQILPVMTAGGATVNVTVDVPKERVWGWDYLEPMCIAEGTPNPITCGIFPTGTGGGASVFFALPSTQQGLPGIVRSEPGQAFIEEATSTSPAVDIFNLPANFPGRNVPDVEFNADPFTGYEIFYTSNVTGFSVQTFFGGTSFVGPQLNGVTALLGQNAGGTRFGLLTVPLYELAKSGKSTLGPNPVFHNITTGDNWFFTAHAGFSPAGGLGTILVSNLANALK